MNRKNYNFNDWDYQLIVSYSDTIHPKVFEALHVSELDVIIENELHHEKYLITVLNKPQLIITQKVALLVLK